MGKKKILILGAGPAGMAAALELSKLGKHLRVIEKNDVVGGLSRTLTYGDFRTDIGPHRFFSQNKQLYLLISGLLGERFIDVKRSTRFYIKGMFFDYPIKIRNVLHNLGIVNSVIIIRDYIIQRTKRIFYNRDPYSFEEQVISNFGKSLAKLNLINYTEKVWGLPCSEISPDWSKQRIKGLSLRDILIKSFKSNYNSRTLISHFYYPETGTGLIYETIKGKIKNNKEIFSFNSYPINIVHKQNKIREVIVNINGKKEVTKVNHLLSSIPITEFITLLNPKVPYHVLNAAKSLRFRSHVSLFLTINKRSVLEDQWVYFPDKEIPFARITEPKKFSKEMAPINKTSLLIEFFCWYNDSTWKADKKELLALTLRWLEKIYLIKKEDIIHAFVHREKNAYPVYDLDYKDNLKVINDYLKRFDNLYLLGRGGSFMYNNQDHALEMGILTAKSVTERKRYNLEEIESKDYFERGYIEFNKNKPT